MTRTPRTARRAACFASTLAIAAALGFGAAYGHEAAFAQDPIRVQANGPQSFADLIDKVSPAVVSVSVTTEVENPLQGQFGENAPPGLEEFFRQFRQEQDPNEPPPEGRSLGSGFVISADGYIVTNNHVVANAKKVIVTLKNDDELDAEIIGVDENTDLAVLKVKRNGLPFVEFETAQPARVGDWVVALGNPFGLGGTATAGIISASGREIGGRYNDFIQIDAPINRGNSGGPTFDMSGRVIGVNSQIFSPSGGNVGIGFAIPAQTAQRVVKELISSGHVTRGWLGVSIGTVTPDIAASLGLDNAKGAIISDVRADGPAAAAGFRVGDVVLEVDGQKVDSNVELTRKVGDLAVGQKVRFRVYREGKELNLTAAIGERPSEDVLAGLRESSPALPGAKGSAKPDEFGLTLSALDSQTRERLKIEPGVRGVVVQAAARSGKAAEKGLSAGDVILEVNGQPVSTPVEFAAAVDQARKSGRTAVLLLVQSGAGAKQFVALSLTEGE